MTSTVETWIAIIQKRDLADLAKQLLGDLKHYRHGGADERDDLVHVMSFVTALRIVALIGDDDDTTPR